MTRLGPLHIGEFVPMPILGYELRCIDQRSRLEVIPFIACGRDEADAMKNAEELLRVWNAGIKTTNNGGQG